MGTTFSRRKAAGKSGRANGRGMTKYPQDGDIRYDDGDRQYEELGSYATDNSRLGMYTTLMLAEMNADPDTGLPKAIKDRLETDVDDETTACTIDGERGSQLKSSELHLLPDLNCRQLPPRQRRGTDEGKRANNNPNDLRSEGNLYCNQTGDHNQRCGDLQSALYAEVAHRSCRASTRHPQLQNGTSTVTEDDQINSEILYETVKSEAGRGISLVEDAAMATETAGGDEREDGAIHDAKKSRQQQQRKDGGKAGNRKGGVGESRDQREVDIGFANFLGGSVGPQERMNSFSESTSGSVKRRSTSPLNLKSDSLSQTRSIPSETNTRSRVCTGDSLYPADPGSSKILDRMTLSVPPGAHNVTVEWNNRPSDFPPLAPGQRAITNILHCLPHGSEFSQPVTIVVDIPKCHGRLDILFNAEEEGQPPAWKRFVVLDAECTSFAESHEHNENKVMLLKTEGKVKFVLRRFHRFLIVENEAIERLKKATVEVFVKTFTVSKDSVVANIKVLIGCDKKNMIRTAESVKRDGFHKVEETECSIYRNQRRSSVTVGIRDVVCMTGSPERRQLEPMKHDLQCLWQGSVVVSLFFVQFVGYRRQAEQLSCTLFVQQAGEIEKPIRIYCALDQADGKAASRERNVPTKRRSLNSYSSENLVCLVSDRSNFTKSERSGSERDGEKSLSSRYCSKSERISWAHDVCCEKDSDHSRDSGNN